MLSSSIIKTFDEIHSSWLRFTELYSDYCLDMTIVVDWGVKPQNKQMYSDCSNKFSKILGLSESYRTLPFTILNVCSFRLMIINSYLKNHYFDFLLFNIKVRIIEIFGSTVNIMQNQHC